MSKTLYVGNLSQQVTKEDLAQMFAQAGGVESISLPLDHLGRHKGVGYITLADADSAEAAIFEWNHTEVAGQIIRVSYAFNQPENL
ncbi:RNA recognition motif domain-containing protein [Streptomyces sp. NPDC058701]|uniref:RNA recognition motif domain-containing protein n=1 Tax=Streptomyces sp. NPDC058701 TaxID=3346608 RepID=UPI00365E69C8